MNSKLPSTPLPGVRVCEDVLSSERYAELKGLVLELQRHLGDLAGWTTWRSFWLPRGKIPEHPIERAIRELEQKVQPGPEYIGAEWWLNFQNRTQLFKPHFDKDEAKFKSEGRIISPLFGSALYFSDVGAPTTFFDVRPKDLEKDSECWLKAARTSVVPEENRYAIFAGDLFHGVIAPKSMEEGVKSQDRITLLVSWWHQRPLPPMCEDLKGELNSEYRARLEPVVAEQRLQRDKYST